MTPRPWSLAVPKEECLGGNTHLPNIGLQGHRPPAGAVFSRCVKGLGGEGRTLSFSSAHESCSLGHSIYRAGPREARSPAAQVKRSFSSSKEAKEHTQDPWGLAQFERVREGEHQG